MTSCGIITVVASDDELTLARKRLRDVVDHVAILDAGPDTQNAWQHPCGWTREEPYEHLKGHSPCAPVGELVLSFEDIWPAWQSVVTPSLSVEGERALDQLLVRLQHLPDDAFRDEIDALDGDQWADIRQLASETLALLAGS